MAISVTATLRRALTALRTEQVRIERQIAALEGVLGATNSRGRGRPRSAEPRQPRTRSMNGRRRPRRRMTAAARRAFGQRMKAYWAARRKAAKTKGNAEKTSKK